MPLGLGISLIVAGLVLVLDAIHIDLPFADDSLLGWILLLTGVLAIVISLVVNQQRSRTVHVQERREGVAPRP